MLVEFAYKNQLFIMGNIRELTKRLAEHASRYNTLKDLLDDIAPPED